MTEKDNRAMLMRTMKRQPDEIENKKVGPSQTEAWSAAITRASQSSGFLA